MNTLASVVFPVKAVELVSGLFIVELVHRGRDVNVGAVLGVALGEDEIDLFHCGRRRIESVDGIFEKLLVFELGSLPTLLLRLTGLSSGLRVQEIYERNEKGVPDGEEEEATP